tara:strand:+ start:933 stop:1424 length:492 start_codon:yes stop_codon:yes gene_type:complete
MKSITNYALRYKGMMNKGERVARGKLQPYGIYKISTYKYAEGTRTSLKGDEETLIFVTGIYDKKVSALKLSNIEPVKFLNWFKKLSKGNNEDASEEGKQSNLPLYEIATPMDRGGNKVYDSYIKNNVAFVAKGAAYRTYNMEGIQHATEFYLKPNVLKQYYGN